MLKLKRIGILARALALAAVLGVLEIVSSRRGRRALGAVALVGFGAAVIAAQPIREVAPGDAAVRVNRLTGGATVLDEGWVVVVPMVHELRTYPLHDQVYRPAPAFQSSEGLSIGVDVAVRWALDPDRMTAAARLRPDDIGAELVAPVVDGVLHRAFAEHGVKDIYATGRASIQRSVEDELRAGLASDGVVVRSVSIGNVELPADYRAALESAMEAELAKTKRETEAEAAGAETVLEAKAQAEAMQHVLPLKEKEIEQKRLEAEAARVARVTEAKGEAEARTIEAAGEAQSRRVLADSDAYRMDVTGKATAAQMAREGELIKNNPLLIQKTLADKLSDKISVIVAPPSEGGFIASGLLGGAK